MLIAICDDEKSEREQVGGILVQKMKKRGEPLQIAYFEQGEDLIEQYESEDQYPGYDLSAEVKRNGDHTQAAQT